MKSVKINMEDRLYWNLKEYCETNHMKIGSYVTNCVERSLYTDKYGDLNRLFCDRSDMPSGARPAVGANPEGQKDGIEVNAAQETEKEGITRKIKRPLRHK